MADFETNNPSISIHILRRLPQYLNYLKTLDPHTVTRISAPAIAEALNLNEVQVRKDLALVSGGGRPKIGFVLKQLIKDLEEFLGYNSINKAVLIGVGHLGRALLSYGEFENFGLKIVVAFDNDDSVTGKVFGGKEVFPMRKLKDLCQRMNIHIGIITVPSEHAQEVCDLLIDAGILAIWNFAPTHLTVPNDILLQNENMALSLAILSKRLKEKTEEAD